jgi:hypothetical protein
MTERHLTPGKEQIELLEPFERLALGQIQVISTPQQADSALQELAGATALGFDTESKPTFAKNEASLGPHIVQLSTLHKGYVFQLEDAECRRAVAVMFNKRFIKSRKATTSNWANLRLTDAQLVYAANDAYAALRVFEALGLAR